MFQFIFVHGVSTRKETAAQINRYDATVENRHRFFTKYCFEDSPVTFHDPYWGKYGLIDTDLKSIPDKTASVLLKMGDGLADAGFDPGDDTGDALLREAKSDFEGVINTLSILLANKDNPEHNEELAAALADYATALEVNDKGLVVPPLWLGDPDMVDDEAFLDRLETEALPDAADKQALGLGEFLKKAGSKIVGAGINLIDGPFEKLARRVTPNVAVFLGDVFVYLKDGDRRKAIREIVASDLIKAATMAKNNNEKLIVAGHSMGANILYDMLIDETVVAALNDALGFEFQIDLFLTVGTQLGLLEEIDVFRSLLGNRDPAPFPKQTARWWHVFNQMDVLSFGAKEIFENVQEFSIDTKANIIDAHTSYFVSPLFHKRLRKRFKEVNILQ